MGLAASPGCQSTIECYAWGAMPSGSLRGTLRLGVALSQLSLRVGGAVRASRLTISQKGWAKAKAQLRHFSGRPPALKSRPRGHAIVKCSSGDSKQEPSIEQPALSGDATERSQELDDGGLVRVAGVVGAATALSKLLGTIREMFLAATFGVGPVMTAFSYSSLIPGFFMVLLGGINGPLHTSIVTALSKRNKEEGQKLVAQVSLVVALGLAVLSVLIAAKADWLIDITAPGLAAAGNQYGELSRSIAVMQLRLMAPMATLAGLIGVGFGRLSVAGIYGLPSLSPMFSSFALLLAVLVTSLVSSPTLLEHSAWHAMFGGAALAVGSTVGAALQWLVQWTAKTGGRVPVGPGLLARDLGLREVLALLLPAAVASGMMQVATYTDLYFASYLPKAPAALGYANLLVQAPLGVLSSAILVPILPLFARLAEPQRWPELRGRIRQGLFLSAVAALPLTASLAPLAAPLVRVVLQRRAFDSSAAELVASLVTFYAWGALPYLARDVLLRAFYALGDGRTPAVISAVAIAANVALDWLAVCHLGWGAQGLVVATVTVNAVSALCLLVLLARKLDGLESTVPEVARASGTLAVVTCGAAAVAVVGHWWVHPALMGIAARISHPLLAGSSTSILWLADAAALGLSGLGSAASFMALLVWLGVPEARRLVEALRARLDRRRGVATA